MLDAARQAIEFIKGKRRDELAPNSMLTLSLVKLVEIVGEAGNQISGETRELIPTIPWADIVAMRNRLFHAYFDINLEILWETVAHDLPFLAAELEESLKRISAS